MAKLYFYIGETEKQVAKLYFYYGAMGSSKTANAIMNAFNFREKGKSVVFIKPTIDNRDGEKATIKSRTGLITEVTLLSLKSTLQSILDEMPEYIIVDEAQFLSKTQVEELSDLVDHYGVNIFCYGLRTDFRGEVFEGSLRLLELADTITEIKTICWCGNKAIMNARIRDGEIIKDGEKIVIGGNDMYSALCRKHWKKGMKND